RIRPGDLVLTLGAGNVHTLGDRLLEITGTVGAGSLLTVTTKNEGHINTAI
ncbi:MAG: hypothetical protein HQK65_20845, partial [Desulfamplus sp.]|nr:hypothetical protein [Desulfamplus sp.]